MEPNVVRRLFHHIERGGDWLLPDLPVVAERNASIKCDQLLLVGHKRTTLAGRQLQGHRFECVWKRDELRRTAERAHQSARHFTSGQQFDRRPWLQRGVCSSDSARTHTDHVPMAVQRNEPAGLYQQLADD